MGLQLGCFFLFPKLVLCQLIHLPQYTHISSLVLCYIADENGNVTVEFWITVSLRVCRWIAVHGRSILKDCGLCIQADLRGIEGLAPDHHSIASVKTKQVIIFLLVEGQAFSLSKTKTKQNSTCGKYNKLKHNKSTVKQSMPVYRIVSMKQK